ncbi:MAG: hypothetical protein WBQ10_03680 [Terriglobales bacterium]
MSRKHSLLAVIATTLLCSNYVLYAADQSNGPGSASQPVKVLAPHKPVMPVVEKPVKWPTPATTRSMVGGFWMTDANFKSSMQIKNVVETDPVKVTPVLYLSNGKRYPLREVALEPSGTAVVSINDALKELGIAPWATLFGYVEVEYHWLWDPVCVTVVSIDTLHSVIFTTGLRPSLPSNPKTKVWMAGEPRPQLIEGMWWKQEANVTGFVALSNTSRRVLDVSLQVTDTKNALMEKSTVSISPHGSKMVKLPDLGHIGNSGGIEVGYVGRYDELLASGGLQDNEVGYSAGLPFVPIVSSSPEVSHSSYAEIGLMTGAADPMMQFPENTTFTPYSVLRNVSDQNVTIAPTLYWMRDGRAQASTLPKVILAPGTSRNLDIPSLLTAAGVASLNTSVNLILDVLGKPRSVLLASGSVDKKNTYVFEVMPHGVMESASKGIGYWSTGNGDDTMVTLWNPADEDQDFVFTLFFSGGHYNLPIHLGPRVTRMFNLSELVQNQVPDNEDNIIPASVHEGSGKLSGTLGENQHILVSLEAGIYNVRKATCHDTCNTCDGAVFSPEPWIVDDPFAVAVGGNHNLTFNVQWNTGIQHNLTSGSTWSSSDTKIATVSAGLVNGVAAGDDTVGADDEGEPWAGEQCGDPPEACPVDVGVQASGGGAVTPTITGPNTVWWFNGQNPSPTTYPVSITLHSTGGPGTTWSVTQADAKVKLSSTSGTDISVTSTGTHFSATGGDISITATVGDAASPAFSITSRTPAELSFLKSSTVLDTTYGYVTDLDYNVLDQLGSVISGDIYWNEVVGTPTSQNGSNWGTYALQTGGGSTPLLDELSGPDVNATPTPSPKPKYDNPPTGATVYLLATQLIRVGTSTSGSGVEVQSDNLTYYIDNGAHTSIVIPPPPPK